MDTVERGRLFVITGIHGAGKSAVGRALAQTLTKSVFVDGDDVGDMVVSGKEAMTPDPSEAAVEQLLFRYVGALALGDAYRAIGFDAVIADSIVGEYTEDFLEIAAPEPVHFVVLHPSAESVRARATEPRGASFTRALSVEEQWSALEHDTARVGLWLDTSDLTVSETVLEIIRRQHDALIDTSPLAESADR